MKRIVSILSVLLLVLAMPIGIAADQPTYMSAEEWEVLSLVNQERVKANQLPLSVFDELQAAADLRASEIASRFEHIRPNRDTCYSALGDIYYNIAGENIAGGYQTPQAAMDAWLKSEGHRANVLHESFKHMAAGYYYRSGTQYTRYWTQLYIGGCTTTDIAAVGSAPRFDCSGNLLSTESMLAVTCDRHGTSYIALRDVDYICSSNQYGSGTYTVSYDGVTKHLPCTVSFTDVNSGAWYQPAVEYAVEHGLMNGINSTLFDPDASMTRAQLVTVIWRMMGSPMPTRASNFVDLQPNAWYLNAVYWAAENQIVNGVGNQCFEPDSPLTRAQLATVLLRFDQMYRSDVTSTVGDLSQFADRSSVPAWAKTALQWAVAEGLINGIPHGNVTYVESDGNATRAQVATILMRYIEN